MVYSIVDIPVEVVADPTYLFTKDEWETFIPKKKVVEDGYILCYFLGDDKRTKQYARKFADKKGLRIVSILSDECQSNDREFADGIAFLYLKRPSCNTCKIKRAKNHADITIGDYHLASGGKFKPYNSDGVSSVVVHNQKGDYLLSIAENCLIEEMWVS